MPILKDYRQTKKVKLEIIEGGEVEVYTSLLASDIQELLTSGAGNDPIKALPRMIKSWNLTDEAEKTLPITPDNVGKLDVRDIYKIINATEIVDEDFLEKGKSEGLMK